MAVTSHPPHRPVLAVLPHTVLTLDLPFVAGVKAHIGKRMQYLRDWKPVFDECPQLLPGGPPLATLCQRREPDAGDLMPEPFEHRDVSRNRMILVVTSEYAL